MNTKRVIELLQYAYFALITLGIFIMAIHGDIIDQWSLVSWIMQALVVYYIYTFNQRPLINNVAWRKEMILVLLPLIGIIVAIVMRFI